MTNVVSSVTWQAMTLEDLWSRMLASFGLKPDTFSLDYEVIKEEVTYEVVKVPVKKE